MTLEEFLGHLKESRQNWGLDGNALRCAGGAHCPLTAIAEEKLGQRYTPDQWTRAAGALGVSMRDAEAIVRAADTELVRPELRKKLLAAVRVKPNKK